MNLPAGMRAEPAEREDAVNALRDFIAAGGYAPGDRLPPEREMITHLDMSRAILRRALDTLEREGAIWRHVGKGTFVAAQGGEAAGGAGGLAALSRQVTPVKLMRARVALEPAIAREAALNCSAEALQRIKRAAERAEEAPNWDDYEAQDDVLHRAVAEATDNLLLLSLFDHLNQVRRAVAWTFVIRRSTRPARDHGSFKEHDRLVAAIEARDPEAAQEAMRAHLRSVSTRLFGDF